MNRLQYESSPYLLQHAHNPVDWYAWKPEAFERAVAEQKPILVSIGYSTCHWCHVMERESFENETVAAFMNAHFINIKVDREERPDVDAIYMEACQLLTGAGGWPLNCFLTPDAKPFYAGTYFPPKPAFNRPGWLQLLDHLAGIWKNQREKALDQAERLLNNIQRNDGILLKKSLPDPLVAQADSLPDPAVLFAGMRARFDFSSGGFGGAPKFPSSMALQWLLDWHYFSANPEALDHVVLTLQKMTGGGIYDQIGGGFARYATDREWLVPHFEKMLYDNALMVSVLSETCKVIRTRLPSVYGQFSAVVEQTLDYIAREMTNSEGAFYSAQDADSEGEEGKFFVWDKSEIKQILGEEAEVFCQYYGVSEAGNWEGKNILWKPRDSESFAEALNMAEPVLLERIKNAADKLLEERSRRVWPGLDDKILLGWNALMCSAYAAAFTAFGQEKYRSAAEKNLAYLRRNFQEDNGSWRHSATQAFAFLDDYAFLIAALVEVYQISFKVEYLQLAGECTAYVLDHFYDEDSGMFFFTDVDQHDILLRKKDLYDNATPSGNSTMALNLQRLGILMDRPDWKNKASVMLEQIRETLEKYPQSFARWGTAMLQERFPLREIAILGENALEKAHEIQKAFLPNKVMVASKSPDDTIPLLAGKTGAGDALIYVCQGYACQKPVSTLEAFRILVNS